jgi:hypothetical protein
MGPGTETGTRSPRSKPSVRDRVVLGLIPQTHVSHGTGGWGAEVRRRIQSSVSGACSFG